jgi:uncharacterized surface protein with fasciclin (FAS1) repeats
MRRALGGLLAASLILAAFAAPVSAARPNADGTIVDTAIAVNAQSGEFSTLIAAVQAAGLVDTLDGRRQFTVFAPTDAAFAKLGLNAGNIATALPTDTLRNILLYHVAPGKRLAADVLASTKVRMLNKQFAAVDASAGTIDGAPIIATDIQVSNGVIHVVSDVLLP